jgi:hypothetical protein
LEAIEYASTFDQGTGIARDCLVRQKVTEKVEGRNRQTDIGVLQRRDRSTERYKLNSFRIMQIKLKLFWFI